MEKTCKTCRWWDSDPYYWTCGNGESEYCTDPTEPGHTCPDWEGKECDDG